MPLNPAQIKDKLSKALDDNKNVVDEAAVEEVISLLETSNLTKEILEQTRLGRDINTVRKTSKNPSTAKRARNLVKAWQKLFVAPGSPQVNGQHPSISRISPGLTGLSPGSRSSTPRGQSPALSSIRQQHQKLTPSRSPAFQQTGGKLQPSQKRETKTPIRRTASNNEDSNLSWPSTPPYQNGENSQDRLTGDNGKANSNGVKNCQSGANSNKRHFNFDQKLPDHSTESTSKPVNGAPDQKEVSKTNVANRKRTRSSAKLEEFDSQPSKLQRCIPSSPSLSAPTPSKSDVINDSVMCKLNKKTPTSSISVEASSVHAEPTNLQRQDSVISRLSLQSDSRSTRERTNKVKTTEQLLEEMSSKTKTPVMNTQAIAQMRTNLIQKEIESRKPNPPPGKSKRGRKKKIVEEPLQLPGNETVSDGRKLAQTKNEYIERFLQTSIAPTPGEDVYETPISQSRQESLEEQPIDLGGCSSTFAQSSYDSNFLSYPSRQDKPDSGPSASPPEARDLLENGAHSLPSACEVSSDRLTEQQLLARLPPIDYENIDWTSHDYSAPQPLQVGPDLVQRLHSENVDSVNGTYDRDGQFRRWSEMLSMDSVYDDPLYILPYVIPND